MKIKIYDDVGKEKIFFPFIFGVLNISLFSYVFFIDNIGNLSFLFLFNLFMGLFGLIISFKNYKKRKNKELDSYELECLNFEVIEA